jgi:hypothetical protein
MTSKIVMMRLPAKVAETIQKLADKKAIGLSTMSRIIILDYLAEKEIFTGR